MGPPWLDKSTSPAGTRREKFISIEILYILSPSLQSLKTVGRLQAASQLVLVIIGPQLFTNKYFYTFFFQTNAGLDDFKKVCPVSCEYLGLQQQKRIFALDGYNSRHF